tara:strand:- start:63 stop:488 length:426 start_codon:yes stop_codon:yes gene_type:complete
MYNAYFFQLVMLMQQEEPDQAYGERPVKGHPEVKAFVSLEGEKARSLKKLSQPTLDKFEEQIAVCVALEDRRVDEIKKYFKRGYTQLLIPVGGDLKDPVYPYEEDAWRSISVGLVDEIHIMDGLNILMILRPDDWAAVELS